MLAENVSYASTQCRMTKYGSFSVNDFRRISCANCYTLLVYVINEITLGLNVTEDGYLRPTAEYSGVSLNRSLNPIVDADVKIIKSLMSGGGNEFDKWRSCCREAELCCSNVMSLDPPPKYTNGSELTCPSIWDGWSCHGATIAGKVSKVKCAPHIIEDTCNAILDHAYFKCNSDGKWFENEYGEWVDYTQCIQSIIPIKERSINVNIISQSISLVFLIIGLIIFFSYRQLRVNRITLHKNFFFSLILHSLTQIIWESVIMRKNLTDPDKYINSNHPVCIIINVLLHYTRSTNYFWMFSESLYLHKLLISVFKEDANLYLYYFIGWGVPFILCSIYSILTFFLNNHSCWTKNIYLMYILNIPNVLTILLNFVFLINIIRVLYKKLTASHTNEPHQYRKAVRATLILVPLFGLHFILSPYVMCESAPGSQIHNLINRLIESLQGLVVAIIYCFLNGEVTVLLKKTFINSKLFRTLIYNHDLNELQMQRTTSDYDYSDYAETSNHSAAMNAAGLNPLQRLITRSLLKKSLNNYESRTHDFKMSISMPEPHETNF